MAGADVGVAGSRSQLQEANSKIASLESQLKSEKVGIPTGDRPARRCAKRGADAWGGRWQEANAKLSEELKKAHERAAKLQTELDKANDQIANLKEEIRKLKLQIEEVPALAPCPRRPACCVRSRTDVADVAASSSASSRRLRLRSNGSLGQLPSRPARFLCDAQRTDKGHGGTSVVDGLTKDLAEVRSAIFPRALCNTWC